MFRFVALLTLSAIGAASSAAAADFHADIHVGVDRLRADGESSTGSVYGLAIGYDRYSTTGTGYWGVELNLDASDNESCGQNVVVANDRACVEAQRDNSIVARVGTRVADRTLVYALAGYVNARFRGSYEIGTVRSSDHADVNGARLGAGVQVGFGKRAYAKVEYRYSNFEDGLSRHQGLFGVGLTF